MPKWFGSVTNRIAESTLSPAPSVGMGCTIYAYTDRYAGTVAEVLSPCRVLVREDHATRTDANGMTDSGQEYTFAPNPKGREYIVTKRRNGAWRVKGAHGNAVVFGRRDAYHDFSF